MVTSFFCPKTNRGKFFKWIVILVVLLIGIFSFLAAIRNVVAYEDACNNAVYVDATITVSIEEPFMSISGDKYYVSRLSYVYDGQEYSGVHYSSGRSPLRMEDDGEIITVMLNPNDPGMLAEDMIDEFRFVISLLILSAGSVLLVYGAAIENDRFWSMRIERERKKYHLATQPDYFKDISIGLIIVMALIQFLCFFLFPHTFGLSSILSSL